MWCEIREFVITFVPTLALILFLLGGGGFPFLAGGGILLWLYAKADKARAGLEKIAAGMVLLPFILVALGVLLLILAVLAPTIISLFAGRLSC